MDAKLTLNKDLIYFFEEKANRDEALLKLASLLQNGGYVKSTFAKAMLEREKIFPTGLPTHPYGIAIPHTDAEHVNQGALAIGILRSPVKFFEMGNLESTVDIWIITMLAISKPETLIPLLRKLAGSFQNENFLTDLQNSNTAQEVIDYYTNVIPDIISIE